MSDFKFIDLFAGVGGMRIPFEELGGECIFASEIDPQACKVYEAYFGDNPYFDITKIKPERDITQDFDILVGGFPCQAFSSAGKRKGLDDSRGRLFEYIIDILVKKRPKAFLLENVKGLKTINKGNTLEMILARLRESGYVVPDPKILNAADYNVPQKRERIYIVGFRNDLGISNDDFRYPMPATIPLEEKSSLRDIIQDDVERKYYLSQQYLDCLKKHKVHQHELGRGFGFAILDPDVDRLSNTLMTGGMGRERNLIVGKPLSDYSPAGNMRSEINRENIRRLTPREFSRLQHFPNDFPIEGVVADTHAYRLFGNSVVTEVVYQVGLEMMKTLQQAGQLDHYSQRDPHSKRYVYK